MPIDLAQQRQQAHELLDLLPAAKLSTVHRLLETMVDEGDDHLSEADRIAIQSGLDSLAKEGGVPMDIVLSDLGLTQADLESGG